MTTKNVSPGTPLASSEEFLPGDGTYDDGEQIRAAMFGQEVVDAKEMSIDVKPFGKSVPTIEKGDIVIGRITYLRKDMASVQIIAARGKEKTGHQQVEASLHASKVSKEYIDAIEDHFQNGDIIRAKVIGLRGGPQLATDAPEFGVIRAFSAVAPDRPLELSGGKRLKDMVTGHVEFRCLANDYGSGVI